MNEEKIVWTVIVRKPDYMADEFPEPYQAVKIEALNAKQAGVLATIRACNIDADEGREPLAHGDYEVVAVMPGLPTITWGWLLDEPEPKKFLQVHIDNIDHYQCPDCGNTSHSEGFFYCDENGVTRESTPEDERILYKCDRCSRIFELFGI